MNFYNKKFRKVAAVLILLLIVAMVATMIIPYLVYPKKVIEKR